ncbi:Neuronal acetylcholine receptor subunit alpha-6, partial [Acropora cervicornis]
SLGQVKGNEWHLLDLLFANYSKVLRPSSLVNISLNLVVANLVGVDPKKGQIDLRIWLRMFWTDRRLRWNSSQFNVSSLSVNFDDLWTPDMVLYSAVGTVRDFGISHEDGLNMKVVIYSNGLVFFSQPTTVQSACAMNIAYFPFDDQVCELTIGSWSMDYTLLRVQLWKGGKDLCFRQNKMWALLDVSVKAIDKVYPVNENPFSTLLCTIKIRRKSLFYVVNFIVPPVTISLLSLLLFLIPPEVGKRMEAGINLLLSLSVYLLLVNSKMPSTSTAFPLLTQFYGCAIIILVLAMCCSCLVYAMYFMNSSGLQTHESTVTQKVKDFCLQWLQPILFGCSCRHRLIAKSRRSRSKIQPMTGTDSTIKVVITSNKPEALTQVTELNSNDAEGLFAFEERSAGDLSGTSSISSTFSFKSNDDCHILTKVYFNLPTAENNDHTGLNPENKKVTFYYQKTGAVKRRSPLRKCDGSAIKQTEHPLISTTSSSWFSQSSCEEIIILENGNEREKKERNDPPAQFDQDKTQKLQMYMSGGEQPWRWTDCSLYSSSLA